MSITNGYATAAALKAALKIDTSDTTDDSAIEAAVEAASRQIEAHCGRGRKFWQDTTVVARTYFPTNVARLCVDDISTKTGLIVKVDSTDDGTFDTTLTINTDFIVEPVNAAAEAPVRPFTCIRLLDGGLTGWTALASGRPYVEVTAKYGWPAVPTEVERATIFQAKNVFKAPDQFFGSFQLGIDGSAQRIPSMDPLARGLLEDFVRHSEVDDGRV